jgi:PhnB protein
MSKNKLPRLEPRLVVDGADKAIDFYKRALGAEEVARFEDDKIGKIVHAEIRIGDNSVLLTDEGKEWGNFAPTSLDGSPVLMYLCVEDADATGKRMTDAGAEVVVPIEDRFYGAREGRIRDPFGHLLIISQQIREMTNEEIQKGVDTFHD